MTTKLEDIDAFDLVKKNVVFHDSSAADEQIVDNFFNKSQGNFLCIGANNGIDQTRVLLRLGWHGVYCEPNPYACAELINNTKEFVNQVKIINCAITVNGGIKDFFIPLDCSPVSSLNNDWVEKHTKSRIRCITINTIGFSDLLNYLDTDFDYIQTDTEGMCIDLIQSINWKNYDSVKMICTEAGPAVFKQLFQQSKFMLTDVTKTNTFYKKIKIGNNYAISQ